MIMTKVSCNLFYFFLLNDLLPVSNPQERASAHLDSVTISDDTLENTFCQYDTDNPPDDVRTLQRDGTSEVLPTGIKLCEPFGNACKTALIMCPDCPDISHATSSPASPSFVFNETVTYTCCVGYEHSSGNLSRTCQEDQKWSGNPSLCTIVSCPPLSEVSHSSRNPLSLTNTYNETVTYACNTGYEKTSGDLSRQCKADKTWSGSEPVCNSPNVKGSEKSEQQLIIGVSLGVSSFLIVVLVAPVVVCIIYKRRRGQKKEFERVHKNINPSENSYDMPDIPEPPKDNDYLNMILCTII